MWCQTGWRSRCGEMLALGWQRACQRTVCATRTAGTPAPRSAPGVHQRMCRVGRRGVAHAMPGDGSASGGWRDVKGEVHAVESLSGVDGPGLRYMLFLQGCNLRCKFCCNPDSWHVHTHPRRRVSHVLRAIERCRPYLKRANGGVTVSGGEPLLQPHFVKNLCIAVKQLGLTTGAPGVMLCGACCGWLETRAGVAVCSRKQHWTLQESLHGKHGKWCCPIQIMSCFVARRRLRRSEFYTTHRATTKPHFVRACTSFRQHRYKAITSTDKFARSREFAAAVRDAGVPMWMRYVLVEGETDTDEDMARLVQFAKDHPNVEKVDLLPYHSLGLGKWRSEGLEYPMEGVRQYPADKAAEREQLLNNAGVPVICNVTPLRDE